MIPRQRLEAVLNEKVADKVPVIIPGGMMSGVLYDLLQSSTLPYPEIHTELKWMLKYARTLQQTCQLDNTGVPFCMTIEAEDFGALVDMGDRVHEPSIPVEPYKDLDSVLNVSPENRNRHTTTVQAIKELSGADIPVCGNIVGPVSLLTSLVPQGTVFRCMGNNPSLIKEALDHVTEHILRFAIEQIEAGADIVVMADPSSSGELIGPIFFENLVFPIYEKIFTTLNLYKKPLILHICGRVTNLIPILKKLEWAGLSVDSLVSLKKLREQLQGRVLMGNVSTQIMAGSDSRKTYRLTRNILETTTILSPACGLSTQTPLANLKVLAQAAEDAASGLELI